MSTGCKGESDSRRKTNPRLCVKCIKTGLIDGFEKEDESGAGFEKEDESGAYRWIREV